MITTEYNQEDMKTFVELSSIRVFVPKDAGCLITEKEHATYCSFVAQRVEDHCGCPCKCEALETDETMIWVGSEAATEDQKASVRSFVLELARVVWSEDRFWNTEPSPAKSRFWKITGKDLLSGSLLVGALQLLVAVVY